MVLPSTVLVIEDEIPLQNAIEIKLKSAGLRPILAGSADAATKILSQEIPDLIWLDLLLPGMGGLEFLEDMRNNEKWAHIPVMIVSVTGGPEKIKRAFELNVIDYMVKSQYRIEEIIARVQEFFGDKARRGV